MHHAFARLMAIGLLWPALASAYGSVSGQLMSSLGPGKAFVFHAPEDAPQEIFHQEIFQSGNPLAITFGRSVQARMDGSDGTMSAYVLIDMKGAMPSHVGFIPQTHASARLYSVDTFLAPAGNPFVTFKIDIEGNGAMHSWMEIREYDSTGRQTRTQHSLNLLVSQANVPNPRNNPSGTFQLLSGYYYQIEYGIEASLSLSAYGMDTATSEKFALSDYANTAHFYVDPVDPNVNLTFQSRHDYSSPLPVPEPSTTALMLLGLVLVGRRFALAARARSVHRDPPSRP